MDEETDLMLRLGQGDAGALAELYDRLGPRVHALALRMLGDPREAEEVVQDTFLSVHRGAGSYRPALGSPRTYLYAIARNAALDRLRARAARPRATVLAEAADPTLRLAAPPGPDRVTRMWIDDALAGIDAEDAELIRRAFFGGYSHAELADATGLPLGTVKSRLRRAMLRLRERMGDRDAS